MTYLPGPEKVSRHVHRVHTRHDELFDSILHVLCPGRPVVPRTTVRVARICADVLEPLAALEATQRQAVCINEGAMTYVVDRGAELACDGRPKVEVGLVRLEGAARRGRPVVERLVKPASERLHTCQCG